MNWQTLRTEFPVTRRWAFFDHAAVAPLTLRAQHALAEYAADLAENGDVNERRWLDRVEDVRGLFGRLLNADPLDIAFVKNTSEGIGIVAEGFPWQPGDNVVIAAEEYPANQYPWLNLGRRGVAGAGGAEPGQPPAASTTSPRPSMAARASSASASSNTPAAFATIWTPWASCAGERGVLFLRRRHPGAGRLPLDVRKRRSTSWRPTATNGCWGRRGRASSTFAGNWSSACIRSASAGTAWSERATSPPSIFA